jgi:O-antigen/teichoic acid export membrane protein
MTQAGEKAASAEVAVVARGSVINLAAMILGAALGFVLTVLVSRWLQPTAAGGLFELIALFTILSNTLELGADTGLTRWISRARAVGGLAHVRRLVSIAVVPVIVGGILAAIAVWLGADEIAHIFLPGMALRGAATDVRIVAPLVPLGAVSTVVLAGPRGFGRMWPYLAIQGIGQPSLRLCLVFVALILGWGLQGALVAWGIPVLLGLVASWLILAGLIRIEAPASEHAPSHRAVAAPRRLAPGSGTTRRLKAALVRRGDRRLRRHRVSARPSSAGPPRLAREFWLFTAPRGFAGAFQVVILWLDVLLVGAILSRYAAGVYGAVSKLAILGAFALSATRLAIGPYLSALLARRDHRGAARLHQSATCWLVITTWPLYILMAIFPAVVLGIFGHRYTAGATALVILSLAMLINLGTGNVTVVLLMGGKSSLSAYNALAALTVNVVLNLILLPRIGIAGAAVAWAVSIAVDNLAPVVEVWLTLGIGSFGSGYWLAAAASLACFGITGLAARALLGSNLPALMAAAAVGLAAMAAVLYVARARLGLTELYKSFMRRSARAAVS